MKKQLLLAAAMILAVGGLSACGNGKSSESGASSSEKTVKKTESKETQTLKKVFAAENKIKSAQTKMRYDIDQKTDNYDNSIRWENATDYTENPVTVKVDSKVRYAKSSSDVQSILRYDGKNLYRTAMVNLQEGATTRQAIDKTVQDYRFQVQHTNLSKEFLQIMSDNNVKPKVENKNGEYLLMFNIGKSDATDSLKEDTTKLVSQVVGSATHVYNTDMKYVEIENYSFGIHADQKTYEPKKFQVNLKVVISTTSGKKFTITHFFEGTIRNINKVQKQAMPKQFEELK